MNDDWRVRVDLHDDGRARRLAQALRAPDLEHDLRSAFSDRVIVSVDGGEVFLYCDTRAQAEAAQRLVGRLAADSDGSPEGELRRWHPEAEAWQDPDVPLPADADAIADEASVRAAGERRDSAEQGYPEFEVRIEVDSWGAAHELSERLDDEGLANVHRWRYVLVGAVDEPTVNALAERLRGELPEARVTVETNPRSIWDKLPGNPFAFLGGLAG